MDGIIKIADFGLSKEHHRNSATILHSCGTVGLNIPPEVFDMEFRSSMHNVLYARPDTRDIWGLGKALYILIAGRTPLHSTALNEEDYEFLRKFFQHEDIIFMLQQTQVSDPMKRMDLDKISKFFEYKILNRSIIGKPLPAYIIDMLIGSKGLLMLQMIYIYFIQIITMTYIFLLSILLSLYYIN